MRSDDPLRRLPILHEDDWLIAVSKPPGLAVHGGVGERGPTVLELLARARPQSPLFPVHRLDRGTSGALLFAKTKAAAAGLQAAWAAVEKRYLALAFGATPERFTVDAPLAERDGPVRPASTRFDRVALLGVEAFEVSLLLAVLDTGRMHQIRRHLDMRGFPIVRDDKYGDFARNKIFRSVLVERGAKAPKHPMLHSLRLALPHPATGAPLRIHADPPAMWPEMLAALGARAEVLDRIAQGE